MNVAPNDDLRPCPFCGGRANDGYDSGNEVWGQSWQCNCSTCNARTGKFYGSSSWRVERARDKEARGKAVAAWNRRA